MRATLQNTGGTLSLALFFTIVITTLTNNLPAAFATALVSAGAPQLAKAFGSISATGALFAAFLGYNPVASILGSPQLTPLLNQIPKSTVTVLEGTTFFPNAIASAFMSALQLSFYIGAALSFAAAVASLLRGQKYVYELEQAKESARVKLEVPPPSIRESGSPLSANPSPGSAEKEPAPLHDNGPVQSGDAGVKTGKIRQKDDDDSA
jgi:hypothetical protein